MIKKFLIIFAVLVASQHTFADEYEDLIAYRDALKEQIATVESETQRCEKTLKGWKAATIVGGVGAVASGIGIVVQNKQIKENDNWLKENKEKMNVVKEFMQEVKK